MDLREEYEYVTASVDGVIMSAWLALGAPSALAASAAQISKDSQAALQSLYKKEPKAKSVAPRFLDTRCSS